MRNKIVLHGKNLIATTPDDRTKNTRNRVRIAVGLLVVGSTSTVLITRETTTVPNVIRTRNRIRRIYDGCFAVDRRSNLPRRSKKKTHCIRYHREIKHSVRSINLILSRVPFNVLFCSNTFKSNKKNVNLKGNKWMLTKIVVKCNLYTCILHIFFLLIL